MRVVYTYDVEDLEKIQGIIKGYNPKEIPVLTTQINHIKDEGKARLRLTMMAMIMMLKISLHF